MIKQLQTTYLKISSIDILFCFSVLFSCPVCSSTAAPQPAVHHPWVLPPTGRVTQAPGLINFSLHSDLGRFVRWSQMSLSQGGLNDNQQLIETPYKSVRMSSACYLQVCQVDYRGSPSNGNRTTCNWTTCNQTSCNSDILQPRQFATQTFFNPDNLQPRQFATQSSCNSENLQPRHFATL